MLYKTKDLLQIAYDNKFALGAFNASSSDLVKAVVEAAEEKNSPALIQIAAVELSSTGNEFIAYIREAINKSSVPMALHLDHGGSVNDVLQAIQNGYNSVMIDGSHLSYEENIAITKEVVAIAHAVNVTVEAELGTIGSNEFSGEGGSDEILYTDPAQAADFVAQTGIDFLAVAVGTSHGIYPDTKDHSIKIDRLKEIQKSVSIPLVLHGGSDNADSEIRESTLNGIAKINLSTDMKRAYYRRLSQTLNEKPNDYEPFIIVPEATAAAKKIVKMKMDLFGSSGKASLY